MLPSLYFTEWQTLKWERNGSGGISNVQHDPFVLKIAHVFGCISESQGYQRYNVSMLDSVCFGLIKTRSENNITIYWQSITKAPIVIILLCVTNFIHGYWGNSKRLSLKSFFTEKLSNKYLFYFASKLIWVFFLKSPRYFFICRNKSVTKVPEVLVENKKLVHSFRRL